MPYDLAREKELVQRLDLDLLTIENWVDDKLAQGLTKQEVVVLFVESGLAERMNAYMVALKRNIQGIDTRQYLAHRDIFIKMIQEWGLDKEPFNKYPFVETIRRYPIKFFHDFFVSHAGPGGIQIHFGQYYRATLLSEGKIDKEWFDAYVISAIAHELGHALEYAAGTKQNNEVFAESVRKLFLDYVGIKKDVSKIHRKRAERLSKLKSNPADIGWCCGRMIPNVQKDSEIYNYLYFVASSYQHSPKMFEQLWSLEQIKAYLSS